MTRIIAIVVVIVAAVLAYMYTSAGDVEVGELATSTEPAGEHGVNESLAPEEAEEEVVTDPAQEALAEEVEPEEAVAEGEAGEDLGEAAQDALVEGEVGAEEAEVADDAAVEEVREEFVEEELVEGDLDAAEAEEAAEAEVLDDTAETIPAEEGSADEEPEFGVGAVSTEEETDGAGIEGIVAEEGEQEGLPGEMPEEDVAALAEPLDEGEPLETPEGLDTTNEAAPEAVIPGEDAAAEAGIDEAAAQRAIEGAGTEEEAAVAVIPEGAADAEETTATAPTDVGPAIAGAATVDPGPALRTDLAGGAAAGADDLDTLLDAENLDLEAVAAAIERSDIEPEQQAQLIEALETAQASPALLPSVLDRIRAALLEE